MNLIKFQTVLFVKRGNNINMKLSLKINFTDVLNILNEVT